MANLSFRRSHFAAIRKRIKPKQPAYLQVMIGPRQVGKTTIALGIGKRLAKHYLYATADRIGIEGRKEHWLLDQWESARRKAQEGGKGAVLVLDEVQKIPNWANGVKALWEEDRRAKCPLHVLLLGSSQLLLTRNLEESLAGRYQLTYLPHWSLPEMRAAFGLSCEEFIYYGGYPAGIRMRRQNSQWRDFIRDSILYPAINQDVVAHSGIEIRKPELLREFVLACCAYPAQIRSMRRLQAEDLSDAHIDTLQEYMGALEQASIVTGLRNFSLDFSRARRSQPKLQVFDNALVSCRGERSLRQAFADRQWWGRLAESAVGAHMLRTFGYQNLFYWRQEGKSGCEVDYVGRRGDQLLAVEVTTARKHSGKGLEAFSEKFGPHAHVSTKMLLSDGIEEFLSTDPLSYLSTPGRVAESSLFD